MMRNISIFSCVLAAAMIILVVAGQIVQYHHHDENDEICLCLYPSSHCHDAHHDDCNHHQDNEDCSLHFEDSIVVDINDHDLDYILVYTLVSSFISFYDRSEESTFIYPDLIIDDWSSGFRRCLSLRAPPVDYYI